MLCVTAKTFDTHGRIQASFISVVFVGSTTPGRIKSLLISIYLHKLTADRAQRYGTVGVSKYKPVGEFKYIVTCTNVYISFKE